MYTLQDLEEARAELNEWVRRDDNYDGGNIDKYRFLIDDAKARIRRIEKHLKSVGIMPYTDVELFEAELDRLFPKAKSKDIVSYNGNRYQRRYFPLQTSRSRKTVKEWGREWVLLK